MLQEPKACQGMAWCEMAVIKTKLACQGGRCPSQDQSCRFNVNIQANIRKEQSWNEFEAGWNQNLIIKYHKIHDKMWQASAQKVQDGAKGRAVHHSFSQGWFKASHVGRGLREEGCRSPTNTDRGLMFGNTNRPYYIYGTTALYPSTNQQQTGESLIWVLLLSFTKNT